MSGDHSVLLMRLQSGSGGVISGMRGKDLQENNTTIK